MLNNDEKIMYLEKGFVAPINIFSLKEITQIQEELDFIETQWPEEITGQGRNNTHLVLTLIDSIAHNNKILDAVESIIGENILITGSTLFIKEPETRGFVSWHQDAKYIGLEPHNWVTAWLAITDATKENGCMQMVPSSHDKPLVHHVDTYGKDNLLTRGQTIENISSKDSVYVELKAGQLSLHHPRIIHGSGPNLSNRRRIGLAIQSYIGTDVKQSFGKIWVQKARGVDDYKYHSYAKRPKKNMVKKDVMFRKNVNLKLSEIFYANAKKKGKY